MSDSMPVAYKVMSEYREVLLGWFIKERLFYTTVYLIILFVNDKIEVQNPVIYTPVVKK